MKRGWGVRRRNSSSRRWRTGPRRRRTGYHDARKWVSDRQASTADLTRRLDLHPAYVAQAYRIACGEGIGETSPAASRGGVRATSPDHLPLAEIAIAAGFCDQSHMNRCFSAVLGRTPLRVRQERLLFDTQLCSAAVL